MKKEINSSPKKNLVKEAEADIDKEINSINSEKKSLNEEIKNTDKTLEDYRQYEKQLQQRIAKLLEREAVFKEKRKNDSAKDEQLSEKLSKIKRIKAELDEV